MARRPIKPLIDKALGGRLDELLADLRSQGLSYETIAARLYSEHGIEVSGETVRVWDAERAEAATP